MKWKDTTHLWNLNFRTCLPVKQKKIWKPCATLCNLVQPRATMELTGTFWHSKRWKACVHHLSLCLADAWGDQTRRDETRRDETRPNLQQQQQQHSNSNSNNSREPCGHLVLVLMLVALLPPPEASPNLGVPFELNFRTHSTNRKREW